MSKETNNFLRYHSKSTKKSTLFFNIDQSSIKNYWFGPEKIALLAIQSFAGKSDKAKNLQDKKSFGKFVQA